MHDYIMHHDEMHTCVHAARGSWKSYFYDNIAHKQSSSSVIHS